MSGEIAWFQAAEIIGVSCRQMRRWKNRWEKHGYEGLLDRRRGQPSPKRISVPLLLNLITLRNQADCNQCQAIDRAARFLIMLFGSADVTHAQKQPCSRK